MNDPLIKLGNYLQQHERGIDIRWTAKVIEEENQRYMVLQSKLDEHLQHVGQFLSDMYATMIDPCEQPFMKVADMCTLLLKTAQEQRQQLNDLLAEAGPDRTTQEADKCSLCGSDKRSMRLCEIPWAGGQAHAPIEGEDCILCSSDWHNGPDRGQQDAPSRDGMLKLLVDRLKVLPCFTDSREMKVWDALIDTELALAKATRDGQRDAPDVWQHIPKQYKTDHWAFDYDEKNSTFFVHCGGHRICDAEDSEVASAICQAYNAAKAAREARVTVEAKDEI